jgi:RNA polymerase sigma-70 factor (ECF subfamily)
VFTIARHRHLDWCRAHARRPILAECDVNVELFSGDDDPAERAETTASTAQALRLIGNLPPEQAEVVALRVIADLDVGQVAAIVHKRPGTVRVLAHRGLRRLAEILDDEEISLET